MGNKSKNIAVSAIGSYALLKMPQSKVDPYTRFTLGVLAGSAMIFNQNVFAREVGIGLIIGSALQILDVKKGGRLSFNNGNKTVFVLHEDGGVRTIAPNQVPDYNIDGFTFKGMNGVFKLSDGVYVGINSDSSVSYSLGVGFIVNKIRNDGLMSEQWANEQANTGWANLYKTAV